MGSKKRGWSGQIKRARRLSNKTAMYDRIRGIVGEFTGDALERLEMAYTRSEAIGLEMTRRVLKEVDEIFGGRNVYISDRTYITKDFFLEMLSQYLVAHRSEEYAVFVMKTFFGITDVQRFFNPTLHLKPGQTIEPIQDLENVYKVTVQEVGEFLIDQKYRVGTRGKIIWRVNWVEHEKQTVELERQCDDKDEYKTESFETMRNRYKIIKD